MGWQNENPASDIRGGGLFSVELLCYLAEEQRATFLQLLRKDEARQPCQYYPFAVAGINLTFTLVGEQPRL